MKINIVVWVCHIQNHRLASFVCAFSLKGTNEGMKTVFLIKMAPLLHSINVEFLTVFLRDNVVCLPVVYIFKFSLFYGTTTLEGKFNQNAANKIRICTHNSLQRLSNRLRYSVVMYLYLFPFGSQ